MDKYVPIRDVYAREILDSRGNPTIEVEILAGEKPWGVQVYRRVRPPGNMKQSNCVTERHVTWEKVWSTRLTM